MIFSRVDLRVPLGPTTPIFAPCRNDSDTLSRTTLSPWALRTLRRVNTYSAMVPEPTGREPPGPIWGGGAPRAPHSHGSGAPHPWVRLSRRPESRDAPYAATSSDACSSSDTGGRTGAPVPVARVNVVAPLVRSCPTSRASTSNEVTSIPALLVQVWALSRPCTTTGSPRRSDRSQFSARPRQALTEYHWVSASTHSSVFFWYRRGVQATRKLATVASPAWRTVTSLPSQPCSVTIVSFIVVAPSSRGDRCDRVETSGRHGQRGTVRRRPVDQAARTLACGG